MSDLTSEVAIEEFMKRGTTPLVVTRLLWPSGHMLVQTDNGVSRGDPEGNLYDLTDEDLSSTDWFVGEEKFL